MQSDNRRFFSAILPDKMTPHRILHHLPQFFQRFSLGCDGMTECDSDKSAIHLVLAHLKNNFAHKRIKYATALLPQASF